MKKNMIIKTLNKKLLFFLFLTLILLPISCDNKNIKESTEMTFIDPATLTMATQTATIIGGMSSTLGFFEERSENRKIISNLRNLNRKLDEVQNYLIKMDSKIDELLEQNKEILLKLDQLPLKIESIVIKIVDESELRNRYSNLNAIQNNFFLLPKRARKRYKINSDGWGMLSQDLSYVIYYENRISESFELINLCEFAIVASEGKGLPVIANLVNMKTNLIERLQKETENNLIEQYNSLLSILNDKRYILNYNFSEDLSSIDQISYTIANDKNTTETYTYVHEYYVTKTLPSSRGDKETQELKTENREGTRDNIANINYNTAKSRYVIQIKDQIENLSTAIQSYAEVRDLHKTYQFYFMLLNESKYYKEEAFELPKKESDEANYFIIQEDE